MAVHIWRTVQTMISRAETDDLLNQIEESRIEDADVAALRAENDRLRRLLAIAEQRVKEREMDALKAENEARRQQVRFENGLRWAEERRIEFLQVCAERDCLKAELKSLRTQPI